MHKNPGILLTAIILTACLWGGGGVAYGLANLVVQLVALAALALNGDAAGRFVRQAPRTLVLLAALSLALPLLQLAPLPPQVWTTLPGRELVAEAIRAVGEPGWRPLTVSTARTVVAFLGLVAPFVVLVFGMGAQGEFLRRTTLAIIAAGVASVLLGAVQVMGQHQAGLLYPEAEMPGILFGFFANRNSAAVFLVSCLLLMCGLERQRALSPRWLAKVAVAVLLGTGVILTQSRTGIVLLAVPLGLAALQAVVRWAERKGQAKSAGLWRGIGIGMLAAIALGTATVAALPGSRMETVLARFEKTEEQRPAIWEDARFSVERYWPLGSGMGTFDEVFQIDESLENISPRRAGRAHNDYLEIAIEAGPFGLLLVAGWMLWTIWAAWGAFPTERRWPALSGAGILLVVAMQSLLDYPLRNQTMLCLAAFAVVLLATARQTSAHREGAAA